MSARINLLTVDHHYRQRVQYFTRFRFFSIILGLITLTLIVSSFFIAEYLRQQIKAVDGEIETFESENELLQKQNIVSSRIASAEKIIAASTNYLPLYSAIIDSGQFASSQAQLQKIEIDANRDLNLSVHFQTKDALVSFLSFIESANFEDQFKSIVVNDINVAALQTGPTELLLEALFNNENIQ